MGLFTKDGIPKNLLRLIEPSLSPGERVIQCAMVSDATAQGTDLLAADGTGDWSDILAAAKHPPPTSVLALTDRQLFLFRLTHGENDPPPLGIPRSQVGIELHGEQVEPSHVVISAPGVAARRYEVPQLYRRQVAAIAAALSAPRPPAAHA
jgi:hypothetical protein